MMRRLGAPKGIEKVFKNGELKGGWDIKQIDEPDVKGYVIRGRFRSEQPLEPIGPNPRRRHLWPEKPFNLSEEASTENREPLIDIFEGDDEIKIYVELPGEERDNIHLNVTEGEIEIKSKNFYKTIKVPANIDIEKASSRHRNSVLEITLPKRKNLPKDEKRIIAIE